MVASVVCYSFRPTPHPPPQLSKLLIAMWFIFRWLHLECEQQVEGFVEAQPGEDYVCCGCGRVSPDLDPPHKDLDPDLEPPHKDLDPDLDPPHKDLEARLTLAPSEAEEPPDAGVPQSEPQPSSPMDCQPAGEAGTEEETPAGEAGTEEETPAVGCEQTGEQVSGECWDPWDTVPLRGFFSFFSRFGKPIS